MIVLDATVLVYARGRAHPLREPCRNLLEAVGSGRLRATTTVEVIQEYCHVRSRRVDVTEASASAGDHADLLRPLIQPGYEDLMAGLAVFALGQGRIGAFDAVLGATAARRQLPVASADGGFELVSGLTRLSPDSASFLEDCLQCG